jgi:hypothetical protein
MGKSVGEFVNLTDLSSNALIWTAGTWPQATSGPPIAQGFNQHCTTGDTQSGPVKFPSGAFPADAINDIYVIVTPTDAAVESGDHVAAVVGIAQNVTNTGFTLHARSCDPQNGSASFNWIAFTNKGGQGQKFPPAVRKRVMQPQFYSPRGSGSDNWTYGTQLWNPLPELTSAMPAYYFLTACDSGINGCDFPPGMLPHNAAGIGIVEGATATTYTVYSFNTDTAGGECNFYMFAIQEGTNISDPGPPGDPAAQNANMVVDFGAIYATDFPAQGSPSIPNSQGIFSSSGNFGDTQLTYIDFDQPFAAPPVVLLTANNALTATQEGELIPIPKDPGGHNAAVVGIAQSVTPNGFVLRARNSDCASGQCGFYWLAIGCGQGCG